MFKEQLASKQRSRKGINDSLPVLGDVPTRIDEPEPHSNPFVVLVMHVSDVNRLTRLCKERDSYGSIRRVRDVSIFDDEFTGTFPPIRGGRS